MKTALMFFSLLVAQFTCLITSSVAQDLADMIAKAEKSVVRIEVDGVEGGGLGSGYVVNEDGMFVTNVHVMAGARNAVAFFEDGTGVKITGTYVIDENRDICVCQLDGSGYEPIPFSSKLPRKGETVIALGAPRGLSFSATTGIVSAIRGQDEARAQMGRPDIEGTWIQVDAALSPGNSGGPLVNNRGEVVAMSTLASAGGRSQNLNFGISIEDITKAVNDAKRRRLLPFADGVGKIISEDSAGGGDEADSMIVRKPIPEAAIEEYVAAGREQYSELAKDIRKSAKQAADVLKGFKKGEIGGGDRNSVVVQRGRTKDKYFFGSARTKKSMVSKQQKYTDRLLAAREKVTADMTNDSLHAILMNNGPLLDGRQRNSIGFMKEGIVAHAYNDHDIIVIFEEVPYLMWVESTAGLAEGSYIDPAPVYVAGTETLQVPGSGSRSVTILNAVSESKIRKAIFGDNPTNLLDELDDFRTWTSKNGKFKFEAIFMKKENSEVVLKNKAGKIVKVALDKLSDADLELVNTRD